mmetsp:Transcript_28473/g.25334  ORF Transcript_28473/g.25334 Transcript_28473/m.25334 type:complete len:92 (-) Transcript_28473:878-1153(-)
MRAVQRLNRPFEATDTQLEDGEGNKIEVLGSRFRTLKPDQLESVLQYYRRDGNKNVKFDDPEKAKIYDKICVLENQLGDIINELKYTDVDT